MDPSAAPPPQPAAYPPPPTYQPPPPGAGYQPPPPGAGYQPPPPGAGYQSTPVQVQPKPVSILSQLGYQPTTVTCPHCHQSVHTQTRYENGLLTWIAVGGLCVFVGWFCIGICLIPFCINDCKDVVHTCTSCNKVIGIKKRLN